MEHQIKITLAVIFFGIIICGNSSDAIEVTKCDNLFQQTNILTREAEKVKDEVALKNYLIKITSSIITAAESYLNNCTDTKLALSKQPVALHKLEYLARQDCQKSAAATQLIDVNNDGNDELVLHTKLLSCEDFSGPYGAGFSVLFFLNKVTKKWRGYPIWPIELLTNKTKMGVLGFIYPQYLPKIFMLDFRDKKGRTFMAIESEFEGGDNAANLLSIIRWDDHDYKVILNLNLSDWCLQSNNWTITKKGFVIVPEASATRRCEKRKKMIYSLEQP